MDMVRHQHIGVHRHGMSSRSLLQQQQVAPIVERIDKDRLAIVTPLNDVVWVP